MAGTPTFLAHIFDRAKPGDLDSLKWIIVSARRSARTPCSTRPAKAAPNAVVLEGYGITECSPVVAVNPPGAREPGTLGKPLPGVAVTRPGRGDERRAAAGPDGACCTSPGRTSSPGYLGYDGPPPFLELDGKRWYVTGDLGELDADGYVVFRGRLKRFLKAGGEMISLPALEEPFASLLPADGRTARGWPWRGSRRRRRPADRAVHHGGSVAARRERACCRRKGSAA